MVSLYIRRVPFYFLSLLLLTNLSPLNNGVKVKVTKKMFLFILYSDIITYNINLIIWKVIMEVKLTKDRKIMICQTWKWRAMQAGFKLVNLGALCNVDPANISRYTNGLRVPHNKTFWKIENTLIAHGV